MYVQQDDVYCRKCGRKLMEHTIQEFHPISGVQLIRKHCPNTSCENGCEHLGHQWSGLFGLGDTCKRCGYHRYDY